MPQADRIYKLAFRRHFTNHEANFPLSQNILLGDYGVIQHGYFVKTGNLADAPFGINLNVMKDSTPTQEEFQSSGNVTINNIAKGEIGPTGVAALNASLEIGFNKESSVYFSSANVLYNELRNLPDIGSKIIELYNRNKWEKRFVIVTKVIEAHKAIIIISGASDCKVSIQAQGPAIAKISVTDLQVKLDFSKSEKVSYKVIANEACQLGFGLSRIYNPLFTKPLFKTKDKNIHLFTTLDESRSVDEGNLAFGDVIPENYS